MADPKAVKQSADLSKAKKAVKQKVIKQVVEVPEVEEPKAAKKAPYTVAPGKALTSKKGILGPGDEAKAEYFAGGDIVLQDNVKSGKIVKNG